MNAGSWERLPGLAAAPAMESGGCFDARLRAEAMPSATPKRVLPAERLSATRSRPCPGAEPWLQVSTACHVPGECSIAS